MIPAPAQSIIEEQQARVIEQWRERAAMFGRPFKEWIGKTADAMPSDRVRLRILTMWERRCYLSSVEIADGNWHVEHVVPIHAGGLNREGNMRPALGAPHKVKSADERRTKAVIDARAKSQHGIGRAAGKIKSAPRPKAEPQRRASKPISKLAGLPPAEIFRRAK